MKAYQWKVENSWQSRTGSDSHEEINVFGKPDRHCSPEERWDDVKEAEYYYQARKTADQEIVQELQQLAERQPRGVAAR